MASLYGAFAQSWRDPHFGPCDGTGGGVHPPYSCIANGLHRSNGRKERKGDALHCTALRAHPSHPSNITEPLRGVPCPSRWITHPHIRGAAYEGWQRSKETEETGRRGERGEGRAKKRDVKRINKFREHTVQLNGTIAQSLIRSFIRSIVRSCVLASSKQGGFVYHRRLVGKLDLPSILLCFLFFFYAFPMALFMARSAFTFWR